MTDTERQRVVKEAVALLKRTFEKPEEQPAPAVNDDSSEGEEQQPTPSVDSIWSCGEAVVALFHKALHHLSPHPNAKSPPSVPKARAHLGSLLALANDKINAVPFSEVQSCWLRLYTDVNIAYALCDLADEETDEDLRAMFKSKAMGRAIKYLDMAIIVAGAPGLHRARIIQDLVRVSQPQEEEAKAVEEPGRPSKRRKIAPATAATRILAPQGIPEPNTAPFVSSFHLQPFILRGHAADWPALRRWGSARELIARVGKGRVVPVEVGQSYTDENWGQEIIPFEDFLRRVGFEDVEPFDPDDFFFADDIEAEEARPVYLAQHSLFKQFPDLAGDMITPDYVYAEPPAPEHMPEYTKPGNADGLVTNVWIGAGGGKVVSPAHTDPYYNCYVQVLGRKRVWLAPPSATPHMYAFDPATPGDATESTPTTSYTTNTSRVPIFAGPSEDSLKRFPTFHREVVPHSLETVLEPGDLLFMPPKWWHAMRSEGEGVSWSVSMWF